MPQNEIFDSAYYCYYLLSQHSLLHLGPSYTLETNADKFFKSFLEEHLLCLGIYLIHFNLSLKIMTAGSKIILEFNFPGSKPD